MAMAYQLRLSKPPVLSESQTARSGGLFLYHNAAFIAKVSQ